MFKNKLYQDKDWLYHQYWELGKSTRQIAKEFGYGINTIRRWMDKFGIPRRSVDEGIQQRFKAPYRNRDWLYNELIIKGKSRIQVARELGVNRETIDKWAKKFEIGYPEKLYQNKEWLEEQYVKLGKSTIQIAEELGVSETVILKWLKRFEIPIRRWHKKGKYTNKEWLYNEYYVKGKSIKQIAEECNVKPSSVRYWFDRFGFVSREKFKPVIGKEWLYQEYVIRKKSMKEIARELGIHYKIVSNLLKQYDIPIRNVNEAVSSVSNFYHKLSDYFRQVLDGSLTKPKSLNSNSCYQHTDKHKNYIEWLRQQFIDESLECGKIYEKEYKKLNAKAYCFSTRRYPCLTEQYYRWYSDSKKIIPDDLKLTPTVVLHWYIGDGSLIKPSKGKPFIHFATNCFTFEEVNFLVDQLNELGLKAYLRTGTEYRTKRKFPYIVLSVKSTLDFFDFIGSCPEPIKQDYNYKWELINL